MRAHPGRSPLVDALRGIAALLIVGYHAAFVLGGLGDEGAGPWLAQLNVGVPLLFAISGFLLHRPFAAARLAGAPRPSLRGYAIRRVLRIGPAYWVALTVIALALGRSVSDGPAGPLTYYGLLQAYDVDTITGGIGQAWTLTVEVAFYAFLGGLAWARHRRRGPAADAAVRREWALLAALAAGSLLLRLAVLVLVAPEADGYLPLLISLPAELDLFVVGMALALVSLTRTDDRAPAALAPEAAWLVAALAFLGLGLAARADPGPVAGPLIEHVLQLVVALGLLAPAALAGADAGGPVRRLLATRALGWVGLVSYGVYLWHLDVLRELERADQPAAVVLAGGLALTLALGAASWHLVERPAIALGRRASGHGPVPPGPPPPVADPPDGRAEPPVVDLARRSGTPGAAAP